MEHQQLRIDALKQVLPDFEAQMAAAGKNVKVKLIENVSNDQEFQTKITLDYSTGNAADIISYPGSWVPDFAAAGYLLDLTDRLKAWPDWEQHFWKVLRDRTVSEDGKNWWMPNGAFYQALWVRKDVLDANGVSTEQPKTWDELISRAKQLQAKLGDCNGGDGKCALQLEAGPQWGTGPFDESWVDVFQGTGGQLYDDATGKWIVRSKALTDSFKIYQACADYKLCPWKPLLNPNPWEATQYVMFGQKASLAIMPEGSYGWIFDFGPTGASPISDINNKVLVWRFPTEDGSQPFVWATETWAWTIAAKTKHPDEAFELLKYLTSGKAAAVLYVAVGSLAVRDDMADIPPYSDYKFLVDGLKDFGEAGVSFRFPVGISKVQEAVAKVTLDLVQGTKDANAAAEEFATMVTESLGADKVENAP